jgi:hypothetical protein
VFVIECVAAVVVPGCLVGYTAGSSGYADDMYMGDLSTYTCYIDGVKPSFFTFIVPLQIVCVSTTTMAVMIIRRIKQSISLRISLLSIKDRSSLAQIALMKRFVVIAIVIPFLSVIVFTACSFITIPSVNRQLLEDTDRYSVCLGDVGEGCSFTPLMSGYAACQTLEPIVVAVIGVLLLIYGLAPMPARQLWASNFRQVHELFCRRKRKDGKESVSQNYGLTPAPV